MAPLHRWFAAQPDVSHSPRSPLRSLQHRFPTSASQDGPRHQMQTPAWSSSLTGSGPAKLPPSWAPLPLALCAPPFHPSFCYSHQPGPSLLQGLCTHPAWHAPASHLVAAHVWLPQRGLQCLPVSTSPPCFVPHHPHGTTASDLGWNPLPGSRGAAWGSPLM